jgi:hypothetical protein
MQNRRIGIAPWGVAALVLCSSSTVWAQVKLEYKFPEGRKLVYKTTSATHQILTIMGNPIETESKETIITSRTVGKKRSDASLPIEEKFESLTVDLSLPGGISVAYDSKEANGKIDHPELAFLSDAYKVISQIAYTVVLDDQKKVKAVEGTEKLLEKADKLNEMVKSSIRSRLEASKLRQQFEQTHGNLPDVLVRRGEPWERSETVDIGSGQTLTFRRKYEYLGPEKRGDATVDKIAVTTTDVSYAMDANAPSPLKVTKSDLKVEEGDGEILFDRNGGFVVSSKGKTRIKGTMTFSAGGQELPPSDLDLTIDMSMELVEPAQ